MKETKTYDPPECFTPEPDNPYPLCIGKDMKRCKKCQLWAEWEPEDPYAVNACIWTLRK